MRATLSAASSALAVVASVVWAQSTPLPPAELKLDLVQLSVAAILLVMIALFWQAARRGLSCLDLITDKGSGKMSLTKVLNVLGGIVGTWTVMRMAIDKSLTWDVFGLFLAYCAGTHAFSTWVSAKFKPGEAPSAPPASSPQ